MATFDGNTIQTTDGAAVAETTTDNAIPNTGALQLSLIKSVNGLTNTTGVDCKLIHGDEWDQIGLPGIEDFGLMGIDGSTLVPAPPSPRGNLTLNVYGNTNTTFNGNVNCLVQPYVFPGQLLNADNDSISIGVPSETDGNVTFTVGAGGSYTETQFGPVTRTFLEPVSETYRSDLNVDQPDDSSFHNIKSANSTVGETCFVGGVVFNFLGLQNDCYLLHSELTVVHAEFMPIHAEATLIHIATKDCNTYGSAFTSDTATAANVKAEVDAAPHQGPGHLPP